MAALDECSPAAHDVLAVAREIARRFRCSTADTAHLMAGLLHDWAILDLLRQFDVDADELLLSVEDSRIEDSNGSDFPPLDADVHAVLRHAQTLARRSESLIRPEHILLAITDLPVTAGQDVLDEFVPHDFVKKALLRRLQMQATPPFVRVDALESGEAPAAVAAFEPPIAALANLAQSGALAEWDEEFVRNTIQQIHLWRERDDANPQIFELLVADLVKKLLDRLTDPGPLRASLLQCGADEVLADDVSRRVSETVRSMTHLGGDDPVGDADLLAQIAESTERTAAAVEGLDLKRKSLPRRAAEQVAVGAAGAVGKETATAALHQLKNLMTDEWPKVQIGLMLAWRAVKDRFIA